MRHKKMRVLFGAIKLIFILLVAIFIISIAVSSKLGNGLHFKIGKSKSEELVMSNFVNTKSYESSLKKEKSDIKGMSKYDKYKMGLNISDGADSDMDGLTDKEEIEKYKSDPTKASTSGDLYQDGYKVAHKMDLSKKYDFKNDVGFPDNNCPEISLKSTSASDFNACIDDFTGSGMYSLPGKKILKVYSVMCYSGRITIDLSAVSKKISSSDVNVYIQNFYESTAKVCKFETHGSSITLKKSNDYRNPYIIYLVKEEATLAKTFASAVKDIDVNFGKINDEENPERSYGILYGSVWNLKIVYVKTKDKKMGENAKKELISVANNILSDRHKTFDESNVSVGTIEDVDKLVKKSKKKPEIKPLCGKCTGKINSFDSYGILYTYYIVDESNSIDYGEATNGNHNHNTNSDFLPFGNFRTEVGTSGVCAGISHLTSYLHNTGNLKKDEKGEFTYKGKTYSWDITKDPENKTLLDKGLSDFKTASFVNDHKDANSILSKNLTDGEKSFSNLISYYWAKGNNSFSVNDYAKGIEGTDSSKDAWTMCFYNGTLIKNIVNQLDKGKYVDAYFLLDSGAGHAVNLIGYEKASTSLLGVSTQGYVFYVYDCNYPGVTGTLTCEIHEHSNGTESLIYNLDIPGASYKATSGASYSTKAGKLSLFVALDSNYNILNSKNNHQ